MGKIFIIATAFFATILTGETWADENPFLNKKFLNQSLRDVGFYSMPSFKIEIRNNRSRQKLFARIDRSSVRLDEDTIIGLFLDGGFLETKNISKPPYYELKFAANLRDKVPTSVLHSGTNPLQLGDNSLHYSAIVRKPGHGNFDWDFRTWKDGHIEWAVADGSYTVIDAVSGSFTPSIFPIKLVAERNPASGSWKLSNYRGTESMIFRNDAASALAEISNRSSYYKNLLAKASLAGVSTLNISEKIALENRYNLIHPILQVKMDELTTMSALTMAYLYPRWAYTQPEAESYCNSVSSDGISDWRVPGIWDLQRLFIGEKMDWKEFTKHGYPVKDTSKSSYWFHLLFELGFLPNQNETFDGDKTIFNSVYLISKSRDETPRWGGFRHILEMENYGGALQVKISRSDPTNPARLSTDKRPNSFAVVCINTDHVANLKFLIQNEAKYSDWEIENIGLPDGRASIDILPKTFYISEWPTSHCVLWPEDVDLSYWGFFSENKVAIFSDLDVKSEATFKVVETGKPGCPI